MPSPVSRPQVATGRIHQRHADFSRGPSTTSARRLPGPPRTEWVSSDLHWPCRPSGATTRGGTASRYRGQVTAAAHPPSAPAVGAAGRWLTVPAGFAGGAAVGLLGGLVGLGGAEFRLPLLLGVFGFAALSAVIVNKTMSLLVPPRVQWRLG